MNKELKFWFTAALRIKDAAALHSEIISRLGPGSECHQKDDEVRSKPGKHWSRDLWMILAPVEESADVNEHLQWIISLIEPHKVSILDWKSRGANIDVFVTYACNEADRGFALYPQSTRLFSELGLTLEVSVAS